jgi:hypothetical protein
MSPLILKRIRFSEKISVHQTFTQQEYDRKSPLLPRMNFNDAMELMMIKMELRKENEKEQALLMERYSSTDLNN